MTAQVPAIERAIRVLYLFKDGEQKEYGVSEISRLLGLNKSTAHNILNTLTHHNFLTQDAVTRRYQLGPALAELGGLARHHLNVREMARPYLRRLVDQTNCTILLGTFDGAAITIVDKEEPLTDLRVTASIGMQLPFCAGSFGQAFLAYLPAETVERLLEKPGLRAFTAASITDPKTYRDSLAQVRAQGYAVDDTEAYLQNVRAISASVFIPSGANGRSAQTVSAVITLVNFSSRLPAEKIAEFTDLVVIAGRRVSELLGATG